MRVITVRQPWAWSIFAPELADTEAGLKDVENRDFIQSLLAAQHTGLAIHTSKRVALAEFEEARRVIQEICGVLPPEYGQLIHGAIIGTVQTGSWVKHSRSPWFFGRYGLEMRSPRSLARPIVARGQLGLWNHEVNA